MRFPILCLVFLSLCFQSSGQTFELTSGKTHAIIIGISDYAEDSIPHLRFAHKDAKIFAEYLMSEAGGSIPADDISLLLNEQATQAEIYQAWRRVLEEAKKDDKVIFYFAGHGDVENVTIFESGYLLAFDTPFNNYINNALRVDDLKMFAKSLTEGNKAKVTFFLDACRSGKLAGSNIDGPSITFKNLAETAGSEIRVMSCKSDQKSLEISTLGDGRGLFSFYLVNGLTGKADGILDDEIDKQVSLEELGVYLKKNVRKVAKKFDKKQDPIIEGIDEFMVAKIDEGALAALEADPDPEDLLDGAVVLTAGIDVPIETRSIPDAPTNAADQVMAPVEPAPAEDAEFENKIQSDQLLEPEGNSAYDLYLRRAKKKPRSPLVRKMKDKLIVALQEKAQENINSYLRGDQAELNKRIYIQKAKGYKKYPKYLAKAAELLGEDDFAYDGIMAKRYYFEGINLRLEAAARDELTDAVIQECVDLQQKALGHSPNAAYIHNEIGVLHYTTRKAAEARTSFEKAIEISPTWSIPQANLGAVALVEDNLEEAEDNAKKALELQEDYLAAHTNLSNVYEKKKDFLSAEQASRDAIKYHWDHYAGFRKLAQIYSEMGDFALSDHMYKESIIRLIGVFPNLAVLDAPLSQVLSASQSLPSPLTEEELLARIAANPLDDEAWFLLGQLYVREDRKEEAEACFLQVIEIQEKPFDVYKDLGSLYQNWERSEDALAAYREYLKISFDPGLASTTWYLLEKLGRNNEAEALISKYMSIDSITGTETLYRFYGRKAPDFPDYGDYWYKRGLLLYNHNDKIGHAYNKPSLPHDNFHRSYWEASVIDDFEVALDKNPNHPSRADIYLKNGELYKAWSDQVEQSLFTEANMKSHDNDQEPGQKYENILAMKERAVMNAEKSHAMNPSQMGPIYQLIDNYFAAYQNDRGKALLATVFDTIDMSFAKRKQFIHTLIWTNELDMAKSLLEWSAPKPFAKTSDFYQLQGMYYDQKGDYSKSIEFYEMAKEVDEDNANLSYKIATLHAQNGNENAALDALSQALNEGFAYKQVVFFDQDLAPMFNNKRFEDLRSKFNIIEFNPAF